MRMELAVDSKELAGAPADDEFVTPEGLERSNLCLMMRVSKMRRTSQFVCI